MRRLLIERTGNWTVRQKAVAYLVAQALLLCVLLAVVVGGGIGVPLPVLVALWCGPALGGLIGILRGARASSAAPSTPGDIDAGR